MLVAVWLAGRDARTPKLVRVMAMAVVAYAVSPIDLIPDFVPVLGYLDDVLILPAGIWLTIRLLPDDVWADAKGRAATMAGFRLPGSRAAAVIIVLVWMVLVVAVMWWGGWAKETQLTSDDANIDHLISVYGE